MIIRIKGFQSEIIIEENTATTLTILNKKILTSILNELFNELEGSNGNEIVIEDQSKPVNCAKDVLCIIDYFNLDFKEKHLTAMIYKYLEELIVQDYSLKLKIDEVSNALGKLLHAISQDLDFGLAYESSIAIPSLLKVFSFTIDTSECSSILEQLLLLIDIYSFFRIKKLIIFINLKSYFDSSDIEVIYKHLMYKKMKFICIESTLYDKIDTENSYLIDEDLVEFNYS